MDKTRFEQRNGQRVTVTVALLPVSTVSLERRNVNPRLVKLSRSSTAVYFTGCALLISAVVAHEQKALQYITAS
jgi:hypothetical protein